MNFDEFINKHGWILCENEKEILNLVKKSLNSYEYSNKERIKKENEMFHLLCFLDINKTLADYYIQPNEPGDFILKDKNGQNTMVELVECFGNTDSNIFIKNQLNKIFERKNYKRIAKDFGFKNSEVVRKFDVIFKNKNENKIYLNNDEFNKKILLIITGEYKNCPITGSWMEKLLNTANFINNKYDKICVLNYFSSVKDGGPTIYTDVISTIKTFKNIMYDGASN